MKTCPNCHHSLQDNAKFCIECGWKLLSNRCPNCNMTVDEEAKFCIECGRNIQLAQLKVQKPYKPVARQFQKKETPTDNKLSYIFIIIFGTIIIIIGFFSSWFIVTENIFGTSGGIDGWYMAKHDSNFVYLYLIPLGCISIFFLSLLILLTLLTNQIKDIKKEIEYLNLIGFIVLGIILITFIGLIHGYLNLSEECDKWNEGDSNEFFNSWIELGIGIGGILTIIGGIVCYVGTINLIKITKKKRR